MSSSEVCRYCGVPWDPNRNTCISCGAWESVPIEDTEPTGSGLSSRVEHHVPSGPVAFAILRQLRDRGFVPCSRRGLGPPFRNWIGILKPQPPVTKRFLFLQWRSPQRPAFLAVLWLNNRFRGASEDKRWVVEVYGRENVSPMTDLFSEIARSCGVVDVTVEMRLESEHLRIQPTSALILVDP